MTTEFLDRLVVCELDVRCNIDLTGNANLCGNVNICDDLTVEGNTFLQGNVVAESNLTVKENLTVEGNSFLLGDTTVDANLGVSGNLQVNGNTELASNVLIGDDLTVGDNVLIEGNLTVNGTTTVVDLVVEGNVDIEGNFDVEGNLCISTETGNVFCFVPVDTSTYPTTSGGAAFGPALQLQDDGGDILIEAYEDSNFVRFPTGIIVGTTSGSLTQATGPVGGSGVAGDLVIRSSAGNVIVDSNLIVLQDLTYIKSTDLQIEDNVIQLNRVVGGSPLTFNGAGIEIQKGTDPAAASIKVYDSTTPNEWRLTVPDGGIYTINQSLATSANVQFNNLTLTEGANYVNQAATLTAPAVASFTRTLRSGTGTGILDLQGLAASTTYYIEGRIVASGFTYWRSYRVETDAGGLITVIDQVEAQTSPLTAGSITATGIGTNTFSLDGPVSAEWTTFLTVVRT